MLYTGWIMLRGHNPHPYPDFHPNPKIDLQRNPVPHPNPTPGEGASAEEGGAGAGGHRAEGARPVEVRQGRQVWDTLIVLQRW